MMAEGPITKEFALNKKQTQAFRALKDPSVLVTLYGGAMGGGKSFLCAAFTLWLVFTYPDTVVLLCRKHYSDLLATTVKSLFKVARDMGVEDILRAGWNKNEKEITLPNKSTILLRGVDPGEGAETFQAIGGLELTMACIDEGGEVDELVFNTLLTRLRHNIPPHGPKLLVCCNPSRNWTYGIFDRHDKGILPSNIRYIHATMFDNDKLDERFRHTLKRENYPDEYIWESQVMGNWRYETGSNLMFLPSNVENAWNWSHDGVDQKDRYLTWDPAYGGKDRSVVMLWRGMVLERVWVWRKVDASQQVSDVKRIISEYKIPARNVSIDGIGSAALVSQFRGCVDHRANARPLDGQAFATLKDQLFFRLSEAISRGELRFATPEIREELTAELLAHKSYRTDQDKNAAVIPKAQITRTLGRSPDLADCVMQRMYFALRRKEMTVDVIRF